MILMNPTWRTIARGVIAPVVAAMEGASRKEIRAALRDAWPRYGATGKRGHAYKIWCEECAFALRDRSRKSYKRHGVRRPEEILKSARDWAAKRGLVEVTAVLDVDGPCGETQDSKTQDLNLPPKRGGGVNYYWNRRSR